MKSLPPLKSLRAFEAIARNGSFTKAALELCVSQGAVSHQLKLLEDYLSINLINRTTREMSLTRDGEQLYHTLHQAFSSISSTTEQLLNQSCEFNLQVAQSFAMLWLLPKLPEFQASYSAAIRVTTIAQANAMAFDRYNFSAGILYGDGNWPNMQVEPLLQEQLTPVCSPGFAALHRVSEQPRKLHQLPLIHSSSDHRDWREWFARQSIDQAANQGVTFESMDSALQSAIASHGITIGDLSLIPHLIEQQLLCCPFKDRMPSGFGYYLVYPPSQGENQLLQDFRSWLMVNLTTSG